MGVTAGRVHGLTKLKNTIVPVPIISKTRLRIYFHLPNQRLFESHPGKNCQISMNSLKSFIHLQKIRKCSTVQFWSGVCTLVPCTYSHAVIRQEPRKLYQILVLLFCYLEIFSDWRRSIYAKGSAPSRSNKAPTNLLDAGESIAAQQ